MNGVLGLGSYFARHSDLTLELKFTPLHYLHPVHNWNAM